MRDFTSHRIIGSVLYLPMDARKLERGLDADPMNSIELHRFPFSA
jgi:hypothetical protein